MKFFLKLWKIHINKYIHIWFCTICIPGAQGSQKSATDLQDKASEVVLSHVMWVLVFKREYPAPALLLRQIPDSQICRYSVEDEDVAVFFAFFHFIVMKLPIWALKD